MSRVNQQAATQVMQVEQQLFGLLRTAVDLHRLTGGAFDITSGPLLVEKLANLWKAGYQGYYSVEHHSAKNEYAEVGIQLAAVRRVLQQFRAGDVPR